MIDEGSPCNESQGVNTTKCVAQGDAINWPRQARKNGRDTRLTGTNKRSSTMWHAHISTTLHLWCSVQPGTVEREASAGGQVDTMNWWPDTSSSVASECPSSLVL